MEEILRFIKERNIPMVKKHIGKADRQAVDSYGDSAVHLAVLEESHDILHLLIQNGFPVNLRNEEGKTPLHFCAEYNLLNLAEMILNAGGDLSIQDNYGNQPLWTAVFNVKGRLTHLALVRRFLVAGADRDHKNHAGMTPILFAKRVGYLPLVSLLEN